MSLQPRQTSTTVVGIAALLSDEAIGRAAEKIRETQLVWFSDHVPYGVRGRQARWFPAETTAWHRAMARAALDGALEVGTTSRRETA